MTTIAPEPPPVLRVEEAAELLRIGRSAVYDLIRTGRLRSFKVGRSRRIPRDAIADAIAYLTEETNL